MEIRSIGNTAATTGQKPVMDSAAVPQSAQRAPSEQVTVQLAKAVPQTAQLESMNAARKPADTRGAEQQAGADVSARMASNEAKAEANRRPAPKEDARSAEGRLVERQQEARAAKEAQDAKAAKNAEPMDEAAMQAEKERAQEAVTTIEESLGAGTHLNLSVEEELGRVVVKFVDSETDEVVKQFPSEDAIALAKSLRKMTGVLFKAQA